MDDVQTGEVYDGLMLVGRLLQTRAIRRSSDGAIVEGMINADFDTTRGQFTCTVMKQVKTSFEALDTTRVFRLLTDEDSIGRTFTVLVGPEGGKYVNFVAFRAKALN